MEAVLSLVSMKVGKLPANKAGKIRDSNKNCQLYESYLNTQSRSSMLLRDYKVTWGKGAAYLHSYVQLYSHKLINLGCNTAMH